MRSEDEVRNVVYRAIATSFRFPIGNIKPETTASDVDGWDSISTSKLFFAIEDVVGIELPIEDLLAANNVGELCTVIFKVLNVSNF